MAAELLGGRYRLERLLGRGGMGEVYRAVDTAHDRPVAVKLLPASAGEDHARRLRREADLVSRLAHPHIVDVDDAAMDEGTLYLAMRLVEGTDLRRVLAGGPVEPERAIRLLSQVASALDAAHAGGIVHRDVKPSNILIGSDDDAHLTDFGIARLVEPEATRLTRTGHYVGSLDYIAPEQLRGHDVTGTADVYALACVLHECLTGKVPFPADDPAAKLAAQLNDPPAAPSVYDPRIPPALDMVVATGMDKDPDRRFAGAGEFLAAAASALAEASPAGRAEPTAPGNPSGPGNDAIVRAIVSVSARRTRHAEARAGGHVSAADECPYPGLRSFGTGDAAWFHGRDAEIIDLLVRLSRQSATSGPLAVVGGSGTGKSSLLRAGLLPALDEAGDQWPRVLLTPGERPVDTLATRLAPVIGSDPATVAARIREQPARFGEQCRLDAEADAHDQPRLMIVVDQFEQLFTGGVESQDRMAFATALAHAWPALVVISVRADYVPDGVALEPLKAALEAPFVVGPLGGTELREVITLPAYEAGLEIENGLVDRLIDDVGIRAGSERGALPRLAHALRETWHNRTGNVLTLAGYQATGGVDRAVAVTADQLYRGLGTEQQAELRRTLLRMVKVLGDGDIARRHAGRDEVDDRALTSLVEARLVSVDDDGVRLSHDALLTAWPRLREWVESDRQNLLIKQRLDDAAANWRDSGRDAGDLYRGARLATALEWAGDQHELTEVEREFLRTSERAQQRSTRRLRGLAAGLGVLLVAALVAGGVAVVARNDAERQAQVALSRQLAAESLALAEWDPAGARTAALKAWHAAHTAEARGALLSAGGLNYPVEFDSGLDEVYSVDTSKDGGLIAVGGATGSGGEVVLWDTGAGERVAFDAGLGEDAAQAVRFSPDGSMLAVAAFGNPNVRVWDISEGSRRTELEHAAVVTGPIAWHPDGRTLAAQAFDGQRARIGAWDPRTGQFRRWLTEPGGLATDLAYSPNAARLAVGRGDGSVELRDTSSGDLVRRSTAHRDAAPDGSSDALVRVAFSAKLLATSSQLDSSVRLLDPATGDPVRQIENREGGPNSGAQGPNTLAFAGAGTRLLTGFGSDVIAWDPVNRKRIGRYARSASQGATGERTINALATSADASTFTIALLGGAVVHWQRPAPWYEAPRGAVMDVAFAPKGTTAAAVDAAGGIHTWEHERPDVTGRTRELGSPGMAVAYAPDGTRVTGSLDGTITVTPPTGAARTVSLPGERFRGELSISGDGSLLAAANWAQAGETRVHVWDLASLETVATLEPEGGFASAVAFAPDGSRLLAVTDRSRAEGSAAGDAGGAAAGDGAGDEPVVLTTWRTGDLDAAPTVTTIRHDVIDAVYSPDGRSIIAASNTGRIEVRNAADGERRRVFGTHPSAVRALALAPDGATVATATTEDSAVWLWDLDEGELRARLTSGSGFEVNDLAFSPDGSVLARGGTDATVALWRVDTAEAVSRICRGVTEDARDDDELGCR